MCQQLHGNWGCCCASLTCTLPLPVVDLQSGQRAVAGLDVEASQSWQCTICTVNLQAGHLPTLLSEHDRAGTNKTVHVGQLAATRNSSLNLWVRHLSQLHVCHNNCSTGSSRQIALLLANCEPTPPHWGHKQCQRPAGQANPPQLLEIVCVWKQAQTSEGTPAPSCSWLSSHSCGNHSQAVHWTEHRNGALCHAAQTPVQRAAAISDQAHSCVVQRHRQQRISCGVHLLSPEQRPALRCRCRIAHCLTKFIAVPFVCRGPQGIKPLLLQTHLLPSPKLHVPQLWQRSMPCS